MSRQSEAVHDAAISGDVLRMETLLREGAEVNARDELMQTSLHWACKFRERNYGSMIDVLLRYGADVNAVDSRDKHPFTLPVRR